MTGSLAIAYTLLLLGSASQPQTPRLVISYSKTPCFGQCPSYDFKLYDDYSAVYQGESFTDKIGNWRSKVTKTQYQELVNIFEESNFFDFKDQYYADISDLPTTYIYFNNGQQEKKVMDYYDAPPELKSIEVRVEELIEELTWKKEKTN